MRRSGAWATDLRYKELIRSRAKEPEILYEDESLIVCVKPAGVPVQGDRSGDYDLVSMLMNHIAAAAPGKGIPYVAPVHRLDRPVGGVIVMAKDKKTAAELSAQIAKREISKRYYCVVTGPGERLKSAEDSTLTLTDYLRTDKKTNLSTFAAETDAEAKKAQLACRPLADMREGDEERMLLRVELMTGRHHQIRVQMSGVSEGIWGDTKYNSRFAKQKGWFDIALFAYELVFIHPKNKKEMKFSAVPCGGAFAAFPKESYLCRDMCTD